MLNELYDLDANLKQAGVITESWHTSFKKLPKQTACLLKIDSKGHAIALELVPVGKRDSLRKWEPDNGHSFPVFNVPPLVGPNNDKAKDEKVKDAVRQLNKALDSSNTLSTQSINQLIGDLWTNGTHLWNKAVLQRVAECLKVIIPDLSHLLGSVPKEYQGFAELMRRAGIIVPERLPEEIRDIFVKLIQQSPAEARQCLDKLLVTTSTSRRNISVVLDLDDPFSFDYPPHHDRVQSWINSCLLQQSLNTGNTSSSLDAFGQNLSSADSSIKFPQVNLPRLGWVKIRAMSSESPCQERYRKADAESFPAGVKIRQSMKNALEWLATPEREGKTWNDISGACGFTKGNGKTMPTPGILLAYPSPLPGDPPELAEQFSGSEDHSAQFEDCAARVIASLNAIVKAHPETEIRVLALAKADKARTKLVTNKRCEARRLIEAAREWQEGCKIPPIRLNLGNDENPDWIVPETPFPVDVARCLSIAWLEGGNRTDKVKGLGVGDGIALLIETDAQVRSTAERGLHIAVSNTAALFLALGHADHRRDGAFKPEKRNLHSVRVLPSLLGLLMYKSEGKGGYMHNAPFLIGNMLALADVLHREYCRHVRDNQLPTQLIGNALMLTALENPERGLARLSERLIIYKAWADKTSGDDFRLAKWSVGQMSRISSQLASLELPKNADDSDKAMMLLGYLARISSDESNQNEQALQINQEEVHK